MSRLRETGGTGMERNGSFCHGETDRALQRELQKLQWVQVTKKSSAAIAADSLTL